MSDAIILDSGEYKPGDPAPEGYLQWHAWAEVQHKSGLRQKECGRCGRWNFPQEMSDQIDTHEARTRSMKRVTVESPVCLKCAAPLSNPLIEQTTSDGVPEGLKR